MISPPHRSSIAPRGFILPCYGGSRSSEPAGLCKAELVQGVNKVRRAGTAWHTNAPGENPKKRMTGRRDRGEETENCVKTSQALTMSSLRLRPRKLTVSLFKAKSNQCSQRAEAKTGRKKDANRQGGQNNMFP